MKPRLESSVEGGFGQIDPLEKQGFMTDTRTAQPAFVTRFWAAAITILVLMLLSTSLRGSDDPPVAFALGTIDEFMGEEPTMHTISLGHYDARIPEGAAQSADNVIGQVEYTVIWLVARPGETPVAFSNTSPWLGCAVQPATADQAVAYGHEVPDGFMFGFLDPCHGGLWDPAGVHLAGPGTRGLGRFPVRLDANGMVLIDLTALWYPA